MFVRPHSCLILLLSILCLAAAASLPNAADQLEKEEPGKNRDQENVVPDSGEPVDDSDVRDSEQTTDETGKSYSTTGEEGDGSNEESDHGSDGGSGGSFQEHLQALDKQRPKKSLIGNWMMMALAFPYLVTFPFPPLHTVVGETILVLVNLVDAW